jgi:hypothetical protein
MTVPGYLLLYSMATYSDELFKTWLERPAEDKFHLVCSAYLPIGWSNCGGTSIVMRDSSQSFTILLTGPGLRTISPTGLASVALG